MQPIFVIQKLEPIVMDFLEWLEIKEEFNLTLISATTTSILSLVILDMDKMLCKRGTK